MLLNLQKNTLKDSAYNVQTHLYQDLSENRAGFPEKTPQSHREIQKDITAIRTQSLSSISQTTQT